MPSPECPQRADSLFTAVNRAGYEIMQPVKHDIEIIRAVHPTEYLDFLEHGFQEWVEINDTSAEIIPNVHPNRYMMTLPKSIVGRAGYYMADTACPINSGTWLAARSAADSALTGADLLCDGEPSSYALCRPPGHHAFSDLAGGFCFLNNAAIAAERLLMRYNRVAILDIDVHHGNGTQNIFYDRDDVFFCSLHGDPRYFYPFFSGYADEIGKGAGRGFNLNIPLAKGTKNDIYCETLVGAMETLEGYGPTALIVSLGLDTQKNDPLGYISMTKNGFAKCANIIANLGVPTLIIQEGGYLCDELTENLTTFLASFDESLDIS